MPWVLKIWGSSQPKMDRNPKIWISAWVPEEDWRSVQARTVRVKKPRRGVQHPSIQNFTAALMILNLLLEELFNRYCLLVWLNSCGSNLYSNASSSAFCLFLNRFEFYDHDGFRMMISYYLLFYKYSVLCLLTFLYYWLWRSSLSATVGFISVVVRIDLGALTWKKLRRNFEPRNISKDTLLLEKWAFWG